MKRREFVQLALVPLATVVRPRLASAQARTPRIGLLAPGSSTTTADFVEELKGGLREHGLVDGENVRLEPAFGETHQALDDLAVQLVLGRSNVSLIIAWSTPAVRRCQARYRHGPDRDGGYSRPDWREAC